VVGGSTAAGVIFAKEIKEADDPEKTRQERIKEFDEKFDRPYEAAERGYIDDVIMPRDTRKIIDSDTPSDNPHKLAYNPDPAPLRPIEDHGLIGTVCRAQFCRIPGLAHYLERCLRQNIFYDNGGDLPIVYMIPGTDNRQIPILNMRFGHGIALDPKRKTALGPKDRRIHRQLILPVLYCQNGQPGRYPPDNRDALAAEHAGDAP